MAILNEISSTACDCNGGVVNTGQLGCAVGFGYPVHAILTKNSVKIDATTDLTLSYINGLIQNGNAIPLMGAFTTEIENGEDTYETSPLGVDALTLKALPKLTFTYRGGEYFYKELAKLTSFGTYRVILGDVNGNWLMAKTSDSAYYRGFEVAQVNAMQTTHATSSESRKKSIMMQLVNRTEIDSNYDLFLASSLFDISEVAGVNSITLTSEDANGVVVPANGDTTIKVKAAFTNDCDEVLTGATEFKVTVNGSVVAATVAEANGFYTLTVPALATADVVVVSLLDSATSTEVASISDVLYRAEEFTFTV